LIFFLCVFLPLYAFLSHSSHYALELHIALLFLTAHSFPVAFIFHCSLLVAFSFFSLNCIFQSVLASSMLLVFLGSFSFFVQSFIFSLWLFFGIAIVVGSHSWFKKIASTSRFSS
jgi:hypothetical protein